MSDGGKAFWESVEDGSLERREKRQREAYEREHGRAPERKYTPGSVLSTPPVGPSAGYIPRA